MRDRTNCPNCGSPLKSDVCEYCGTTFYDLASLEDGTPCYMRVRIGNNLITFKAIPKVEAIINSSDTTSVYDGWGNRAATFVANRNLDMEVTFSAIADEKGNLMSLTMTK